MRRPPNPHHAFRGTLTKEAREKAEGRKEEERQVKVERNADKLIRALAKHPAGESKSTLRDLAGLSGTEVNAALALLLERGEAVSAELLKGNRKTPITGYKLAE